MRIRWCECTFGSAENPFGGFVWVVLMGISKKDYHRRVANIKAKIAALEPKVRMDPLRKHPQLHNDLAKLKKDLEKC